MPISVEALVKKRQTKSDSQRGERRTMVETMKLIYQNITGKEMPEDWKKQLKPDPEAAKDDLLDQ
jgi:hypothetical protein